MRIVPPATARGIRALNSFILAVPLWLKLTGANSIVIAVAITGHAGIVSGYFFGALGASALVNVVLVTMALRPLRALEQTAAELWRGNRDARVAPSALADRDIRRLGITFNLLVESLIEADMRSRELTQLVIAQSESDRAQIAYDLRESMVQQLVALALQMAVIARDTPDPGTRTQMQELREMTDDILDELRLVAREIAPPDRQVAITDISPALGLTRLSARRPIRRTQ